MAMKNLVDGECGGANALVRAADHFTQRDHRELLHQPHFAANVPLDAATASLLHGDQVFRMDALLSDIERVNRLTDPGPVVRPKVRNLPPDQWVSEFASSAREPHEVIISGGVDPVIQSISRKGAATYYHPHQQSYQQPFFQPHPMSRPFPVMPVTHNPVSQRLFDSSSDHLLAEPFLQQQEERLSSQQKQQQQQSSHQTETRADQRSSSVRAEGEKLYQSVGGDEQQKADEFIGFVEDLAFGKEEAAYVETDQQQREEDQEIRPPEEKDDLAFWSQLAQEWDQASKEDTDAYSWLGDYGTVTDPFREGYFFKDDNPLKEVANAFEEGMRKLQEGDIPSAVLLFEAACQQDPENATAWQFLGTTQAKNEQDPAAIRALRRALELEPNNLTSLMSLAVSYTNESYQKQACDCLAQWIRHNPAYAECSQFFSESTVKDKNDHPMIVSSVVSTTAFQQTREAFIHAARKLPQNLDPDIQCGLGVLFNLTGEYEKAIDCFRAALAAKPDDALLWNRLGATLANGQQSEEAIEAYRRALEISPGFLRCRFNLGVSCINLSAYREAAEHFLTVLNFQNAGRGPSQSTSRTAMSSNVWTALRMVLSLLNRQDLYSALESKDLPLLNREFNVRN